METMINNITMNTMTTARYIAYYEGENNYYNDSDFYLMILDLEENKVIKHVYGTTRFAGSVDFEHEYLDLTKDKDRTKWMNLAEEIAEKQVLDDLKSSEIEPGDVVQVTNPRVRKFKNEIFTVDNVTDFKLRYNYVASITAHGKNENGDSIKSNVNNLSIIKHSDKKIKRAASRLAIGLD